MNKKIGEKEVRAKVLHRLRGLNTQALKQAAKVGSEMVAGAMFSIHKGTDIGQGRSSLTAFVDGQGHILGYGDTDLVMRGGDNQ